MDPRDPSQRPSIFTKPEPIEDLPVAPQEQPSDFWRDSPVPRRPFDPERVEQPGPSRRLVIGLGVGGVVLLAIGGLVAGALLGPPDDAIGASSPSVTPSTTATAAPSIEPTPTAEPSATAAPTPVPTPAGPPQEVPVGAWATVVVDELNVRSAPGADATSNYLLVRGSVIQVAEGPTVVADLNWYRIASLGGAVGWVTSGWVAEPFVATLVEDPTLIRCGEVGRAVFDVVNGVPTPHDPISIGELALPAAAFSNESLAAMELVRGVGGEACFSAHVGSAGVPVVSAQLQVGACGHAVADGDFFRLRPAAGQDVPPESQVKDPVIVHPTVLAGAAGDRQASNMRAVLTMMAAGSDATGCVHLNVTQEAGGVETYRAAFASQCSIVTEYNADNLRMRPAAGGDSVWIKLSPGQSAPNAFPLGEVVAVAVNVSNYEEQSDAYAYQAYGATCA